MRLFYIFQLICVINLFYSHQVMAKLEHPCVHVQNEIMQKYTPMLDKPFKQKGLNFVLKDITSHNPLINNALFVTRNTYYEITQKNNEMSILPIQKCEILLDEKYETILRCLYDEDYYFFAYFYSNEQSPYQIDAHIYFSADKEFDETQKFFSPSKTNALSYQAEINCSLYQPLSIQQKADIQKKRSCTDIKKAVFNIYTPKLSAPFKQEALNFVLNDETALHRKTVNKAAIITKEVVYDIFADDTINPILIQDCKVLIDEERKTILRCNSLDNRYLFIQFYSKKETPQEVQAYFNYSEESDMQSFAKEDIFYFYVAELDCPLFEN